MLPPDHADRMTRARLALDGLSVGDAFGELFFRHAALRSSEPGDPTHLPPYPWQYTDDTEMALGICEVLDRHGRIDQDDLARTFTRRWGLAPDRGYGPGAWRLLTALSAGGDWRRESRLLFGGMGSFGNGSAMRVAPLGAYFADDPAAVVREAKLSAEVTHHHWEGIAGGIAVAVAAAFVADNRDRFDDPVWRWRLFDAVLAATPPGETRTGIERARGIGPDVSASAAAGWLGNGRRVTCQDTVPFCLWSAAAHLTDYGRAVWETAAVGGDVDTNAAIVGGLVVMAVGRGGIPPEWLARREELE